MAPEHEHVKILKEISEQFQPLFQKSPDGIYVYIDEVHKICNERFARMFGLSVAEWEAMEGFVNKHAAPEDQALVIDSYQEHIHQTLTPARFRIKALRKDGSAFRAEIGYDPVPMARRNAGLAFRPGSQVGQSQDLRGLEDLGGLVAPRLLLRLVDLKRAYVGRRLDPGCFQG